MELWAHQQDALLHIKQRPATLLYNGLGTGKTLTALAALADLEVSMTLWVGPKAALYVVARDLELVSNGAMRVVVLDQTPVAKRIETARRAQLDSVKRLGQEQLIFVTNYEAFDREPMRKWALHTGLSSVVLDEAHRIKSHRSKRSRFFHKLGRTVDLRLALTGTPTPQDPFDCFGIFRFLDPTIFGMSYTAMRARYGEWTGYLPPRAQLRTVFKRMKPDMEAEFQEKFYSITHRVDRDDVLELPDLQELTLEVDLPKEARRIYDELKEDALAELGTGEWVATPHVLEQLLRLRQITGGSLPDGTQIHTAKLEALQSFFEDVESDEPVVVFAQFRRDLDMIKAAALNAGRASFELSGRFAELGAWQEDAGGSVLAVQLQSGAEGIDCTRARYGVYYSIGFSLGQFEQSLARLHRPGQKRKTLLYHLVARNTIDIEVYKALAHRKKVIRAVLDNLKKAA